MTFRCCVIFVLCHITPCPCLVSPYLKSLSMVAANKLLHLLEAFSTNWFLFSAPQNHHLAFFLLEAFNNIIQYQFDGEIDTLVHLCQINSNFVGAFLDSLLPNLPTLFIEVHVTLLQIICRCRLVHAVVVLLLKGYIKMTRVRNDLIH